MNQFVFALLLITSVFVSCKTSQKAAKSPTSQKNKTAWKVLQKENYEVKYPENWLMDTSGKMRTKFIVTSPLEGENDPFQENINLMIQDLTGLNMDREKFTNLSLKQVQTLGAVLVSSETKKAKGREYQRMVYTLQQGTYDFKFEQKFWITGNKAYLLTFTANRSDYERYQGVANKIMDSFEIK